MVIIGSENVADCVVGGRDNVYWKERPLLDLSEKDELFRNSPPVLVCIFILLSSVFRGVNNVICCNSGKNARSEEREKMKGSAFAKKVSNKSGNRPLPRNSEPSHSRCRPSTISRSRARKTQKVKKNLLCTLKMFRKSSQNFTSERSIVPHRRELPESRIIVGVR